MKICAAVILVVSAVTLMTNPKKPVEEGSSGAYSSVSVTKDGDSSAVSIIGGKDGPTSIFVAGKWEDKPESEDNTEGEEQ